MSIRINPFFAFDEGREKAHKPKNLGRLKAVLTPKKLVRVITPSCDRCVHKFNGKPRKVTLFGIERTDYKHISKTKHCLFYDEPPSVNYCTEHFKPKQGPKTVFVAKK